MLHIYPVVLDVIRKLRLAMAVIERSGSFPDQSDRARLGERIGAWELD